MSRFSFPVGLLHAYSDSGLSGRSLSPAFQTGEVSCRRILDRFVIVGAKCSEKNRS
jgi:hypothetical protein